MLVKGNRLLLKNIKSILLIQLGDIGDVILSFPCIRALKENFPKANIIVAVREKAKELIEDCPWVTETVSINKKKRKPYQEITYQKDFFSCLRKFKIDLAIDLRTGTRGAVLALLSGAPVRIGRYADDGKLWRNRVFTHLVSPVNELSQYAAQHNLNIISCLNLKISNRLPFLSVPLWREKAAFDLLKEKKVPFNRPIIAIHPFSLWKYKEWKTDEFVSLIDYLTVEHNFPVIITGSAQEQKRGEALVDQCRKKVFNFAGKTNIGTFAALIKYCGLLIGVDTAALHIAAAVKIPTIGIFGPSSPVTWAPRGDQHYVVAKSMECVPCREKGCENSETSRCLEKLTFKEVKKAVDLQLKVLT